MAEIKLVKQSGSLTLGKENNNVEEVYVGNSAPAEDKGYKVWVNPEVGGEEVSFATTKYVDDAVAEAIADLEVDVDLTGYATEEFVEEKLKDLDVDVDLTGYATEEFVNSAIEAIELTPGPAGEPGKDGNPGEPGYTPVKGTDYWTEEDKAAIVQDVLEAMPAAEEVGV